MKRINERLSTLVLIGVTLVFAGCQRKSANANYQTQIATVSSQIAVMISNAKLGRGVKSSGRGSIDYSSLGVQQMSAPYGGVYMSGDYLAGADRCYTYISQLQNQIANGQTDGTGKYQVAMATLIQCQMASVQHDSAYGAAAFRAADTQGQTNLTYAYNWPQYGSNDAYYSAYANGSNYGYLQNLGQYGSLTNQTGSAGAYAYPYSTSQNSGSLQNYFQ